MSGSETEPVAEIARLKSELELVKSAVRLGIYIRSKSCRYNCLQNPFRMAEIAIELQIERLRVTEITKARDTALQHLAECYVSIRRKNELIEQMRPGHVQEDNGDVNFSLQFGSHFDSGITEQLKAHITTLEVSNKELRQPVAQLQASATLDLPPLYEADVRKVNDMADYLSLALTPDIRSLSTLECKQIPTIPQGLTKRMAIWKMAMKRRYSHSL